MPRDSEFSSYVFIKNDLQTLGWNTLNPSRNPVGQLYTQQECLDNPEISPFLGNQRPEYVLKVRENIFWVIEAKGSREKIQLAFEEAKKYAEAINRNPNVHAFLISGVAGNDSEGYLVRTAFLDVNGIAADVTYNDKKVTGFLSPDQARYLTDNQSHKLNELIADEQFFLLIAESINNALHDASINKDARATVIASLLLSMISDTLPNFNASPDVFVRDINNRAEDVLISHSKREFAEQIELRLPLEESAKEKYKEALVKVFFLLRKINIKAAMNGEQDVLGKFYEVFLKYGNGAKDIGIVLTPRHITKFSAEILDVNSRDIIYDPACGTGGFLVAGYDRVRREESSAVDMFKKHRIFGVEQQANVAALAIVNMIFRGDGKNNIINDDCLKKALQRKIRNDDLSAEYCEPPGNRPAVTKVLMNPPFALSKDDEQEYRFLEHALSQMVEGGLLLSVLPISVMYSGKSDLEWRKRMLETNTLLLVASFPNDLFYPQCSVEPVIIVIKRGIPHSRLQKTLWLRVLNDGYRKHKKRRLPISGNNDLTIFTPLVKDFLKTNTLFTSIVGFCQAKPIDLEDRYLELIPQQYLDNPSVNSAEIETEAKKLFASMVFQHLTGSMIDIGDAKDENI